jgi:hypothetical protein
VTNCVCPSELPYGGRYIVARGVDHPPDTAAADPGAKARIFAAYLHETTARTADVQRVIESAAATDPDKAQPWDTLIDQLIRGMTVAVTALHAQGALRPDLTFELAAGRLWWYAGPWACRGLVLARGWSLDEHEAWPAQTLYTQLMTLPAPPAPPARPARTPRDAPG